MKKIEIVNANIVEKISQKSNKPYTCLEIEFSNGYKKNVLLSYFDLYRLSN